ncbi:sensor histidine kinase [Sphingomonas sp. MMS24-J45]|uniref:sensor histidine kinase n=1 Tax=Sphingomonas sp. MMS24-J45 TaxID=3238806 RepID=UPI00384ED9DA
MKRPPSALVYIGGFGIAVATLSVATTAAIVILAPPPPVPRTSAAEVIGALQRPIPGFERRLLPTRPKGERVSMLETLIADELNKPLRDVQVSWLDNGLAITGTNSRSSRTTVIRTDATKLPPSFVLLQSKNNTFKLVTPSAMPGVLGNPLLALPLPAFTVSVRQADNRWLSVSPAQPFLAGWQRSILIALAVSLLLIAPVAWIFARRLTRPFRALAGALDHQTDIGPTDGPRELREAAAAIAAMRSRVAIEAAERARMLTAIAHDLRTPLTGLRLRIEAAPEPQRSRMVADVERMQSMIDEVLAYARDAAAPVEILDTRPLLATIVEEMKEAGAPISLLPGGDACVAVPTLAFRRAVENLLRNAVTYAGGGTVALRRTDGQVFVSVADSGPGIPATDRERLLRPFERGDSSRNRDTGGAGLGLSIVSDLAARYGGEFGLAEAPDGRTIATLRLPEFLIPETEA